VVAQAAVEGADEAVGEGSEGLMMGGASTAVSVVEGSCTGRGGERGEGLLVERVGASSVPGVAGQHDSSGAGGFGDRCHPGVVLPRAWIGVAVGVVSELGKHRGGEELPEPGLAQVDLSVRVLPKPTLTCSSKTPVWVTISLITATTADMLTA